jgi:hypothetical protein
MVKLAHHPSRGEMRRLRERWDVEDGEEEIPLKPFDTTLTSGINDTVQHLRTLRADERASAEGNQLRFDALEQLTKEARFLREALAGVVETLNRKASKRVIAKEFADYAAKLDKRIDNIFKLVGALGVILGIIIAIKGH